MSAFPVCRALVLALVLGLAACAGGGGSDAPRAYDLGIEVPAAPLPALELRDVRALRPFDGMAMFYRLSYTDGAELAVFAHSRWAAPPAALVRKQLARAMRPGAPRCTLDLELQEFSQVFDAKDNSAARVELVATLVTPDAGRETLALRLSESGAGGTAAQGAKAMQRAVARAIADLAGWVGGIAACRG